MKKLLEDKNRVVLLLITGIFFLFFALITHWTPASGDDWVYAVGGMWNNPFKQALVMYQTWSGRYLSELWGFLVAPHKSLWNILNPLLFTGIFLLLIKLSDTRYPVLTALLAMVLIFSVGNRVRMQTYTWIMGTTYVVPLLLFLLQVQILRQWLTEKNPPVWQTAVLCVLNFCIPLYMENAAALIFGGDLLVLIYCFCTKNPNRKKMILIFAFAAAGSLIILSSPGAAYRMVNDNAEFNALSLGQKIAQNWPLFLERSFTESLAVTLAFTLFTLLWAERKRNKHKALYGLIVLGLAAVLAGQGLLYLIYTIGFLAAYIVYEEHSFKKWFVVYLVLCAGGANAVMLVSPIFDSRSSLYTVYLLLLTALVLAQDVPLERKEVRIAEAIVLCGLTGYRMASYYDIYHTVHLINIKRYAEIEYYRLRPDAGDAWLVAYPDESIHSPNVQEWDDTHMYYFKEYYSLSQDLHLIFYYLDEYNAETIFAAQEQG